MKISVCIATYNGEKYIKKQLMSIIEQLHDKDEIVITDDCSSDDTLVIINELKNNYNNINWVISKNDIRLGFCKNFIKAIGLSTGEYVFLSDQDDIWEHNKIPELIKIMKHNTKIDLLFSSYRCIDKNDVVLNFRYKVTNNLIFNLKSSMFKLIKYSYHSFVKSMNVAGMSMCIRKDFLDEFFKLDLSNIKYHDLFLALFASLNDGLYYYNKVLVNYRIHDTNTIGLNTAIGIKDDRVDWLEHNIKNQQFMKEFMDINSIADKYHYLKRIIDFNTIRLMHLKNKDMYGLIGCIGTISRFPSLLSFAGDLLYVIYNK